MTLSPRADYVLKLRRTKYSFVYNKYCHMQTYPLQYPILSVQMPFKINHAVSYDNSVLLTTPIFLKRAGDNPSQNPDLGKFKYGVE